MIRPIFFSLLFSLSAHAELPANPVLKCANAAYQVTVERGATDDDFKLSLNSLPEKITLEKESSLFDFVQPADFPFNSQVKLSLGDGILKDFDVRLSFKDGTLALFARDYSRRQQLACQADPAFLAALKKTLAGKTEGAM